MRIAGGSVRCHMQGLDLCEKKTLLRCLRGEDMGDERDGGAANDGVAHDGDDGDAQDDHRWVDEETAIEGVDGVFGGHSTLGTGVMEGDGKDRLIFSLFESDNGEMRQPDSWARNWAKGQLGHAEALRPFGRWPVWHDGQS